MICSVVLISALVFSAYCVWSMRGDGFATSQEGTVLLFVCFFPQNVCLIFGPFMFL